MRPEYHECIVFSNFNLFHKKKGHADAKPFSCEIRSIIEIHSKDFSFDRLSNFSPKRNPSDMPNA
jgi:hypothetical protein